MIINMMNSKVLKWCVVKNRDAWRISSIGSCC